MIRRETSPSHEGRGKGRDFCAFGGFKPRRARERRESLPRPLPSREGGFTLMEIVLAIALTSVVMYLLMTAIELYTELAAMPQGSPRFLVPLSGLYWQTSSKSRVLERSRSLWDRALDLPDDMPAATPRAGSAP